MKIALYIEDGIEQIVLTPATEAERRILNTLLDASDAGGTIIEIKKGKFYECLGGWIKQGPLGAFGPHREDPDESTMIVLRRKKEATE